MPIRFLKICAEKGEEDMIRDVMLNQRREWVSEEASAAQTLKL
jgi:hypothetical protein